MTNTSKQGPDESFVVSNVLRLRVPYFPLSKLNKNGVIESNRQIIENESGKAKKIRSRKADWEMRILIAGILFALLTWLIQAIFS